MIGKTLAHYEIMEKLGSGGMGDVYRARDSKLGREVAIKVLPEEFSRDPDRRKRFAREAQAIAALKHPNIVTIYSVEENDGLSYITMELVEGETLAARIPTGGITLDQFFEFAIPLADAVSSAHEKNITHRDLKPANIMFDHDGRLKVLDFGLAKLLDPSVDADVAKTQMGSSDTAVGQVMGTAAYMSPEQAEGKTVDHRTDIFSLGIVMYQMATGERPFTGDTQISTISSVLKDSPRHISEIKQDVPRHVGRIVSHCLEKRPDSRYQSAKDVRNELVGLKKEIDSGELSATMTSTVSVSAPQPSRRWMPAAIAAAVVVIAAAAFFGLRSSGTGSDGVSEVSVVSPPVSVAPPNVAPSLDDREMVVVLPFENRGPAEDAYFAAGMTDEITSRLSAVSGLGVISSTSATQYDRSGKTIKQIGEDLGVDYVIEGSVRWAKSADGTGRVRVTPKLIRVADDTQVWSQTYDREIDDIFEVQSDIATRVIDQLDVTLVGSEREMVEGAPTNNVEAYNLYLQAEALVKADFVESDARYNELLQKAVELDPEFIDAWSNISTHHMLFYANGLDQTDERLARARSALRKAEQLDPHHAMTHFARGYYLYYGFNDYDQALEEFLAATKLAPNHALARFQVGNIYRRQGRWTECVENQKAAMELDPQSGDMANQLASTYRGLLEFEAAHYWLERARAVQPQSYEHVFDLAMLEVSSEGDIEAARKILETKPDDPSFFYHLGQYLMHAWSSEYVQAVESARAMDTSTPVINAYRVHLMAFAEAVGEGREAARPSLEEANQILESVLESAPDNDAIRGALAENLALLGQEGAAVREAKLIIERTRKDKFFGPGDLERLARVYALSGRADDAVDILEQLLDTVYVDRITPHALSIGPMWDPIRDNPRFQALIPRNI